MPRMQRKSYYENRYAKDGTLYHQKGSLCVESYERESEYHLAGKLQLYQWLENQKLCPELEPFYQSIRQRPDIGVSVNQKNFALEFQCSTIPPELLLKRTKYYQAKGVTPVWIMGGKNIKRKGEKKVSLFKLRLFISYEKFLWTVGSPSILFHIKCIYPLEKYNTPIF